MAKEAGNSSMHVPAPNQNPNNVEATMKSGADYGATKFSLNKNNSNNVGSSVATESDKKVLEYTDELIARGSTAAEKHRYAEAVDCYRRALTIRVAHFGELAPECVKAYYKYGDALLCKARVVETDTEDLTNNDDVDEPKEVLEWKGLDIAPEINEKHSGETMEKGDILSALARLALQIEEYETSISHFLEALSILKRLVKPDSRLLAQLNFRLCVSLEKAMSVCQSRMEQLTIQAENFPGPAETPTASEMTLEEFLIRAGVVTEDMQPSGRPNATGFYGDLPSSIGNNNSGSTIGSQQPPRNHGVLENQIMEQNNVQPSSSASRSGDSLDGKEARIGTLTVLFNKLAEMHKDLELQVSRLSRNIPMKKEAEVVRAPEKNAISVETSSSEAVTTTSGGNTTSRESWENAACTDGSSGVTHKRVLMNPGSGSSPMKKPTLDPFS